jgi:hypothetical protein
MWKVTFFSSLVILAPPVGLLYLREIWHLEYRRYQGYKEHPYPTLHSIYLSRYTAVWERRSSAFILTPNP